MDADGSSETTLEPGSEWRVWAASARESLAAGDAPRALELLRSALEVSPRQPELRELLGIALVQNHQPAEAIGVLQSAVDDQPTNARLQFNLANAYRAAGKLPEAHRRLDVVLKLDSRYARAVRARSEWAHDFAPATAPPAAEADLLTDEDAARQPEPRAPAAADESMQPAIPRDGPDAAPEQMSVHQQVSAGLADAYPLQTLMPAAPADQGLPARTILYGGQNASAAAGSAGQDELTTMGRESPEAVPGAAGVATIGPAAAVPAEQGASPPSPQDVHPAGGASAASEVDREPGLATACRELLLQPRLALRREIPRFLADPLCTTSLTALLLIVAFVWGPAQVLEPGSSTSLTFTAAIASAALGAAGIFVMVWTSSALCIVALGAASRSSFERDFPLLSARFGLTWSLATSVCLLLALPFVALHLLSVVLFVVFAFLWTLVLDLIAVEELLHPPSGPLFVAVIFSHVVGDLLGLGILQLARLLG